jgi:hypothetical protein
MDPRDCLDSAAKRKMGQRREKGTEIGGTLGRRRARKKEGGIGNGGKKERGKKRGIGVLFQCRVTAIRFQAIFISLFLPYWL